MSSTPPNDHNDRPEIPIPPPGAPFPPPGGIFAEYPSLPTPMSEAEAMEQARHPPGFVLESPSAATAKATASVLTYREHLRRWGGYSVQLGLTDPVIIVVVEAPVVVHAGSRGQRSYYSRYEVSFDPRTGRRLGSHCPGDALVTQLGGESGAGEVVN